MNADSNSLSSSKPRALRTILVAGLIAGASDITAAFIVYGFFGAKPMRILQGVASGLLGPASRDGGIATAMLGLLCQFVIATLAATVFYLASRGIPFLVQQAVMSGVLYGIAVYFVMDRVVVPLSRARQSPFSFRMMVIGIVIHICCVGLPIALTVQRFSVRQNS